MFCCILLLCLYRKPHRDASGRDASKDCGSLRDMNDVILMTSRKSNEDTNSPRGPIRSAESSSPLNSSNRSSPANSDSSGRLGFHLTDSLHGNHEVVNSDGSKCLHSSKPSVSIVILLKKDWPFTFSHNLAFQKIIITKQ